jgi:hypothetical protein
MLKLGSVMTKQEYQVAGGSVIGTYHLHVNMNNQDHYFFKDSPYGTVGIVCDGCGSGAHSEVGAKFGAKYIGEMIHQLLSEADAHYGPDQFLPVVWRKLTNKLEEFTKDINDLDYEYNLFTVVGFYITKFDWANDHSPNEVVTFSIGDGYIALNGHLSQLEPDNNNAPSYPAYANMNNGIGNEKLGFVVNHIVDVDNFVSLMIATDGVEELIDACGGKTFPGKDKPIGPLEQFWREHKYFTNPMQITRCLRMINTPKIKIDWKQRTKITESGLLPDDTTLIVCRKKQD